ncbi:MAG: hypothetical protein JW958_06300 [Candidatus Eisenbacteria bacterium]|nr:hypothetical protein [Candidatus Eisenbacteria bacterium]
MTSKRKKTMRPFVIRDCALSAIAIGVRAQNLRELRDLLRDIHPDAIYYHFWGGLLRPRIDDPEYNNDFAAWAAHGLHDERLAERLAIIDPTDYDDLENLRSDILDVVEERLDESEYVPWSSVDNQFAFIRSQIVVFNTHRRLHHPEELVEAIPHISLGSIFFHVIDARRRTPDGVDDFHGWLRDLGDAYSPLCNELTGVDPYFTTLADLRRHLSGIFRKHLGGEKA